LFVSTSFLAPHGFDLWRQLDSSSPQRAQLSEPPVEARLWEDPFAAQSRHRLKMREVCGPPSRPPVQPTPPAAGWPPAAPGSAAPAAGATAAAAANSTPTGPSVDARCQDGQAVNADKFKAGFAGNDRVILIAALLPGGTFVGGEEQRRRSRYALLTGLADAGYVPDDSEHMRLVHVQRCDRFDGCPSEKPAGSTSAGGAAEEAPRGKTEIVYEMLRIADGNEPRRIAVVLWIDETAAGRRWLSAVTAMLRELRPAISDVKLRIVGPSGSEPVVRALDEDLPTMIREA